MNWLAIIASILHRTGVSTQKEPGIPNGYRRVRCPSCEETHLRPYTVRERPLPRSSRTDTIPIRLR